MIQRVLLVFIGLTLQLRLWAGIAYPYPIPVKTDKGEAYITICGDESCKYGITEDGYTVVQDSEGWYFAYKTEEGSVQKSAYRIEAPEYRGAELQDFLSRQEKYLRLATTRPVNERRFVSKSRKRPVVGNRKVLIVMVQFSDVRFTKKVADFDNLFNQRNYSSDGAAGSVSDYYDFVSHGQLNLVCDVFGPYTAQHEMAYYGQNVGMGGADRNPYALFQEALSFIRSQVNLAEYDADEDGYVDNMHIIYAGYGEEAGASSEAIWAHEMTFNEIDLGNVRIDRYSCAPELRGRSGSGISRIGPHCHEIGHALGAMDYYDTDYQAGGTYQGTGNWDIMASGSWNDDGINPANFNPYVRVYDFGWDDEIIIDDEEKDVSLAPSYERNSLVRLNTPVEGEFFLLENRRQVLFDKAVPGEGLLIFHIGSGLSTKGLSNSINATFPQECSIVCASSTFATPTFAPKSYGEINSSGCPFPGSFNKNEYSANTTPAATCQDGTDAGFALTEIEEANDIVNLHIRCGKIETGNEDNYIIVGDTIWKDNFNQVFLSNDWKQETIVGGNYWKIAKHIDGASISCHAQLEYPSNPWSSGSDRISTMLISPEFQQNGNNLLLSFNLSGSGNSQNSLSIHIRKQGDADWQELATYSAPAGIWKKTKILLEENFSLFEIALCGIVSSGGKVMIDNLVLQKVLIDNTGITERCAGNRPFTIEHGILTFHAPDSKPDRIYIYDLRGRCVYDRVVSFDIIPLESDFYVIRYGNEIQKIYVP